MDESSLISIVSSSLSAGVCILTLLINQIFGKIRNKQNYIQEKEIDYRKNRNSTLIEEIKMIKSSFLDARDNVLVIYFNILNNHELKNKSLINKSFKSNLTYERKIYENNLYISNELLKNIKQGKEILDKELANCLTLANSKISIDEIPSKIQEFSDKCTNYLDNIEKLLDNKLLS